MSMFNKSVFSVMVFFALALIWATATCADTILPLNNSLESPATSDWVIATPNSWSGSYSSGSASRITNKASAAAAGIIGVTDNQYDALYGGPGTSSYARLWQNLSNTIAPATQYQLLTDFTVEPGSANAGYTAASGTMTMRLSAWSGTTETTIATIGISGSAIDATAGTFATFSLPATLPEASLVGQQLRVYYSFDSSGHNWSCSMDNVRIISNPIPEPSTLALLAAGLIGLLCYAWRKQK